MHIRYDSQSFSKEKSQESQFKMETGWNDGFLTLAEVEVYISIEGKKQMKGMLRDKLSLKYPLVWVKQYTVIVTESSQRCRL